MKMSAVTPIRLAVVVSHPIQHFVPLYRRLAVEPGIDLRVFFMSDFSLRAFVDPGFGQKIMWSMDMTSGYPHEFLPEASSIPSSDPAVLDNPSLLPRLEAFRPHVVLCYGYVGRNARRLMRWSRAPKLMISDSEPVAHRPLHKRVLKRAVLPLIFSRFHGFLTTGDNNEAYLRDYGVSPRRMFRSPFTIDEVTFTEARRCREELRAAYRARFRVPADRFVALGVGKLVSRKRPQDVLDAARAVERGAARGRIQFLLAGSGELRDELQRQIDAERLPVTLLGFVGLDDLPAAYAAADVIVHPAEADPHPLVMSEAACMGIPVIVSDRVGAVGPSDIVRPHENGLVFRCGDSDALARHVTELEADRARHERMCVSALDVFADQNVERSVAGIRAALVATMGRSLA